MAYNMAYNYFNWQETMRLKQYRATLEERRKQASISSVRRRQLSLGSTGATEPRHRSRFANIPEGERSGVTRNLEHSFMTLDADGVLVPKTAEGALLQIGAYLRATAPPAGDPAAVAHQQQMKALALAAKGLQTEKGRERSRSRSWHTSRDRRSRSPHRSSARRDAYRRRALSRSKRSDSSDSGDNRDTGPCGARCFTRRIREAKMPKKFSLSTTPKFNCRQEPSG